jgi:hypothetical protein
MGHFVTGLIAKPNLLGSFARRHSLHDPVEIAQGLAFLPLRDQDIDSFLAPPHTGHAEGFTYLSEQLQAELAAASDDGDILYFETEYFGGAGAQGAAVFSKGALFFGPRSAEQGPINEALRVLGVSAGSKRDEFEAVGLDRHRHTEDWLESAA